MGQNEFDKIEAKSTSIERPKMETFYWVLRRYLVAAEYYHGQG